MAGHVDPAAQPSGPSGRDRRHLYLGRSRRVALSFTEQEMAILAAANAAAGVTPTGFCADAALAAARWEPAAKPGWWLDLDRTCRSSPV